MKPYGHKRRDDQTCKFGCCFGPKHCAPGCNPNDRKRIDRAGRKRARRFRIELE